VAGRAAGIKMMGVMQALIQISWYPIGLSVHSSVSLTTTATTTILRPFVWDYPGEPVPEETLTHPPS